MPYYSFDGRLFKELSFENQSFKKKTSLACAENCPHIQVTIPIERRSSCRRTVSTKVFSVLKELIYFGENIPQPIIMGS
jgi:hypothetical protein